MEVQLAKEGTCRICHTFEDLLIHHIDEDTANNALSNFATLCRGCHAMLHKARTYLRRLKDHPELIRL